MYRIGQVLLVTAVALAVSGSPGYTDGPIAVIADNGATVEQLDATSWNVTLTAAGDTTIRAGAVVDGNPIAADPSVQTAADPATSIVLTVAPVAPAS